MEQLPDERDEVQRLIALKRHETPPPGYYRDFARGVRRRIESEQGARQSHGWQTLWSGFTQWPRWKSANALIGTGLALLALTAVFTRPASGPQAPSPAAPATAGIGGSPASLAPRHDPTPDHYTSGWLTTPVGVTYRIEILIDSNALPHSLYGSPLPASDRVSWPAPR